MMRVTWTTNLGPMWSEMPEGEVMAFLQGLALLGFTAEVTLDTADEN